MDATDSDFILPGDAIGHSPGRNAGPEPSYVQSVLFGRKRERGTRSLPVAPLVATHGSDRPRPARQQERN